MMFKKVIQKVIENSIKNLNKSIIISNYNYDSNKLKFHRWEISDSIDKTNLKIDYANEDNCGVCSENKIIK